MAFDLLYCDCRDLTGRPVRNRRAWLEDVVAGSEQVFPVRRLAPDGQVVERGYEATSPRIRRARNAGGPTRSWLKVKVRAGRSLRIGGGGGSRLT
jgi:ATP-dependent DNA ligase